VRQLSLHLIASISSLNDGHRGIWNSYKHNAQTAKPSWAGHYRREQVNLYRRLMWAQQATLRFRRNARISLDSRFTTAPPAPHCMRLACCRARARSAGSIAYLRASACVVTSLWRRRAADRRNRCAQHLKHPRIHAPPLLFALSICGCNGVIRLATPCAKTALRAHCRNNAHHSGRTPLFAAQRNAARALLARIHSTLYNWRSAGPWPHTPGHGCAPHCKPRASHLLTTALRP